MKIYYDYRFSNHFNMDFHFLDMCLNMNIFNNKNHSKFITNNALCTCEHNKELVL